MNKLLDFDTSDNLHVAANVFGTITGVAIASRLGLNPLVGGAAGLSDGPGVAAFRLFIGAGIAKQEGPRQADFDVLGSFRSADLCPESLEVVNGWKDDDGCKDRSGVSYSPEPKRRVDHA